MSDNWPVYHLPVTWDAENKEHQEIVLVMHPDGHVRWMKRIRGEEK